MADEVTSDLLKETFKIFTIFPILLVALLVFVIYNSSYESREYSFEFEKAILLHPNSKISINLPHNVETMVEYDEGIGIQTEEDVVILFTNEKIEYYNSFEDIQNNQEPEFIHYFLDPEFIVSISAGSDVNTLVIETKDI